jgi:hypothetical protein
MQSGPQQKSFKPDATSNARTLKIIFAILLMVCRPLSPSHLIPIEKPLKKRKRKRKDSLVVMTQPA